MPVHARIVIDFATTAAALPASQTAAAAAAAASDTVVEASCNVSIFPPLRTRCTPLTGVAN